MESKLDRVGLAQVESAPPETGLPITGAPGGDEETNLPGWGIFRRFLHGRCRSSRWFNSLTATIEMRLNREELISLPQYIGLCPTGQCNALCEFCSVTINRTGIVKQQQPFDRLEAFLRPTLKTVFMYGLEGNGEPTLYREFDDLVRLVLRDGGKGYLITNGSRIRPDQIPMLLSLEAINFSLNACTAESHKRVMKLKNFDEVVASIQALVKARGSGKRPMISVSFVVTNDNIHELQDFLYFAEYELGVDEVLVRPLSEIANESGPMEDHRDIVPFESDILDMIAAVGEYIDDVPRRARISFDPSQCRSFRADPPDRRQVFPGREDRLLAPRRDGWRAGAGDVDIKWHLAKLNFTSASANPDRPLLESDPVPLDPARTTPLFFAVEAKVQGADLRADIIDGDGKIIASGAIQSDNAPHRLELAIPPGPDEVTIRFNAVGAGAMEGELDFGRVRKPWRRNHDICRLPNHRRWQVRAPDAKIHWSGETVLHLDWSGPPGENLVQSYGSYVTRDGEAKIPFKFNVERGALKIIVAAEGSVEPLAALRVGEGVGKSSLKFDSVSSRKIRVAILSDEPGPLKAEIDWLHLGGGSPSDELPHPEGRREKAPETLSKHLPAGIPGTGPNTPGASPRSLGGAAALLHRLVYGRTRFVCQKPWTDLNNFTVDGRIDVCCIATGASQSYYELGNFLKNGFQEIWNGERMREFRRTVNGPKPLPPCARCPMQYAYQGPLFAPQEIKGALRNRIFPSFAGRPGLRMVRAGLLAIADFALDAVIFRGFRR